MVKQACWAKLKGQIYEKLFSSFMQFYITKYNHSMNVVFHPKIFGNSKETQWLLLYWSIKNTENHPIGCKRRGLSTLENKIWDLKISLPRPSNMLKHRKYNFGPLNIWTVEREDLFERAEPVTGSGSVYVCICMHPVLVSEHM